MKRFSIAAMMLIGATASLCGGVFRVHLHDLPKNKGFCFSVTHEKQAGFLSGDFRIGRKSPNVDPTVFTDAVCVDERSVAFWMDGRFFQINDNRYMFVWSANASDCFHFTVCAQKPFLIDFKNAKGKVFYGLTEEGADEFEIRDISVPKGVKSFCNREAKKSRIRRRSTIKCRIF